jgi:hypothetical protein
MKSILSVKFCSFLSIISIYFCNFTRVFTFFSGPRKLSNGDRLMFDPRFVLYLIPTKLICGQNQFSSPPTPFETRGRNVTICPANICCYHCGTSSILKCSLPTTLYKYTNTCSQHSRTNLTLTSLLHATQLSKECFLHGQSVNLRCSNRYALTPSRLYRNNLSSIYNCCT